MIGEIRRLLLAIESGTKEETWEAAKQLSSISTEVGLALVSLLTKGKNSDARAAAAYVLGTSRYECARTSLEEVLSKVDEEPIVRGHAAEGLGYIRNRESVRVLLRQLKDETPVVKYWCTFALGQIGDPAALPALKLIAESSNDQYYENHSLRSEALEAIAEIERLAK